MPNKYRFINSDRIKIKIAKKLRPDILAYHLKSIFIFIILIAINKFKKDAKDKDIAVAAAAPAIPNLGMSKMLNTTFVIAEKPTILKPISGRPTPVTAPPIDLATPKITVPTINISKGKTA